MRMLMLKSLPMLMHTHTLVARDVMRMQISMLTRFLLRVRINAHAQVHAHIQAHAVMFLLMQSCSCSCSCLSSCTHHATVHTNVYSWQQGACVTSNTPLCTQTQLATCCMCATIILMLACSCCAYKHFLQDGCINVFPCRFSHACNVRDLFSHFFHFRTNTSVQTHHVSHDCPIVLIDDDLKKCAGNCFVHHKPDVLCANR
jgi:hypothetical protein